MLGQTQQIDLVVKEPGEGEWRVVLEVLESEWQRARAVWLLEEKLNAYAGFIFDGHMRSLYPASTPATTHVVIASVDPLPEEAITLLDKVKAALEPHAVRVSWDPSGGMPNEGVPPPEGFPEKDSAGAG